MNSNIPPIEIVPGHRTPVTLMQACRRFHKQPSYFYKLLSTKEELRACGYKANGKSWIFDLDKLENYFMGSRSVSQEEINQKASVLT